MGKSAWEIVQFLIIIPAFAILGQIQGWWILPKMELPKVELHPLPLTDFLLLELLLVCIMIYCAVSKRETKA